MLDTYKKATGFSGGIKFGGGDTDTDEINQPGYFGVKLRPGVLTKTIRLPKGAVIWGYMALPGEAAPSAGTADIGTAAAPDTIIADVDLTAASKADRLVVADVTPLRLTEDTDIVFTATGLVDGEISLAVQASIPTIRY